jgi:hypothetical protein
MLAGLSATYHLVQVYKLRGLRAKFEGGGAWPHLLSAIVIKYAILESHVCVAVNQTTDADPLGCVHPAWSLVQRHDAGLGRL